jgi:N-acetylmuramoyl-L-alanine amidase
MRAFISLIILALLSWPGHVRPAEQGLVISGVRHASYATFTRVVFEVEAAAPYSLTRSSDGRSIMLGAYEGPLVLKSPLPLMRDQVVASLMPWEESGRTFAVIRLHFPAGEIKDFTLRGPDRIVIDIMKDGATGASAPVTGAPVVIVLDPGHGGGDSGLLTGQGIEKIAALNLALAVKKILSKSDRLKVVLTRERDQALTLDERAALANAAGAAVFVSLHAAAGPEARTYIQDLADVPAAPAQPVVRDFLGYETGSEERESIWGKQQAGHAQNSGELGRLIARRFAGQESAEPVQAPLAGLKAVDAAAVLVEVSLGQDPQQAAEIIAGGIESYAADSR